MPLHRFDPDKADQAAILQRQRPIWLVMWRAWARTYTAFHMGDSRTCCVIDAPTTVELQRLMTTAELDLWRAPTLSNRPPIPGRPGQARHA